MHHLADNYINCHFVRKGAWTEGKTCTCFMRFQHAQAAAAVIRAWNGLYIPSIGPKPLGLEMAQDNLVGARSKATGPPLPLAPPPSSSLASPLPPTVAAPPPPVDAAPIVAPPLRPSVAVPIVAASPRPSVAVPSVTAPTAPKVAAPIVATPSSKAKSQLDPATHERYAGLMAGYIIPKSKGKPSKPSAQLPTIPPWKKSRYYTPVPPRGSARRLVDLSEPNDEGFFEAPPNPAEAGTSRSSTDVLPDDDVEMVASTIDVLPDDVEMVASRNWVEHPWEPTQEDLT